MSHLTRRAVLVGAAAAGAATALGGPRSAPMTLPVLYLPHGGGPWPWMQDFGGPGALDALRGWLEALPSTMPAPKAILCVTAHWEAPAVTVSTAAAPPLLYDYYGFPEHTYRLSWPAPGAPDLAQRVRGLLAGAGIASAEDGARGYDHGTFVPLAVAWPNADVPVLQVSLIKGLDPAAHLAVGRALKPLRDEGVLIVGSGMSYHNMRGFGHPEARASAQAFDDWMVAAVADPATRDEALIRWAGAPHARACHPREEHLLPLMVVAGAAGADPAAATFRGEVLGMPVSAVQFGRA